MSRTLARHLTNHPRTVAALFAAYLLVAAAAPALASKGTTISGP